MHGARPRPLWRFISGKLLLVTIAFTHTLQWIEVPLEASTEGVTLDLPLFPGQISPLD